MLQFKYMVFINFARTLCRVGVVWKREEGYIFYTCFILSACPFLIHKKYHHISLEWGREVYSKYNRLQLGIHSGVVSKLNFI